MKKLLLLFALLTPAIILANGETISPNMSLPVPAVGITTGPEWAEDIVDSLDLIDAHDHSSGKGVQVTPAGLDINSDLSCGANNLTNVRSSRYSPQGATFSASADVGAVYVSGVDLYYRDVNGNNIRLTQGGSIVGTAGSISGLVSPASASYVAGSSTFVWQSAVNTSANMDAACLIQRNVTASSNGITLCAPAALASNYSLTWPAALPGAAKVASIDASGNIATGVSNTVVTADITDLNVTTGKLANLAVTEGKIAASAVTTTKIQDASVTKAKQAAMPYNNPAAAGEIAVSNGSGAFTTSSTGFVSVTNLSVTLATTGRPTSVQFVADGASDLATANGSQLEILIRRDSTDIAKLPLGAGATVITVPTSAFNTLDWGVSSGSHTYTVFARAANGVGISFQYSRLVVYEL